MICDPWWLGYLSRQRAWGVPLPIFYAEDGTPWQQKPLNMSLSFFEEHGFIVQKREAKDLLTRRIYSSRFSKRRIYQGNGYHGRLVWLRFIMEGCSGQRPWVNYPADLYLEGSDQYRGWFNSSLYHISANHGALTNKSLSQGFALDGKGKMSKPLKYDCPSDVENNLVRKSCVSG